MSSLPPFLMLCVLNESPGTQIVWDRVGEMVYRKELSLSLASNHSSSIHRETTSSPFGGFVIVAAIGFFLFVLLIGCYFLQDFMYIAENNLEHLIPMPLPPVSWDYWGNHTWFIQCWESNPCFVHARQALPAELHPQPPKRNLRMDCMILEGLIILNEPKVQREQSQDKTSFNGEDSDTARNPLAL